MADQAAADQPWELMSGSLPASEKAATAAGRLQGKVALVTGGGRGIGRGISLRFAREGASLVVAQRDITSAERTVAEIQRAGGEAIFVRTDVADRHQISAMVDAADKRFGRLDILVNNASITGLDKSVVDMAWETWQYALDTNLSAVFLGTQAAARVMIARGIHGSVINIASINSYQAQKHAIHYVATKGAIPMLTEALAIDLSEHGIRVNAIAPGMISTERTGPRLRQASYREMVGRTVPLGRTGTVEEIAALATFLASDECRYIQGETILVDGGLMAHLRLE